MGVGNKIKDLLHFNRGERGGLVVLLLLLGATIGANLLIPGLERPERYDFSEFDQAVREFEARRAKDSLAQAQQLRKPQKYFPKNEGSKKRSSYPTRKNRGSYPDRTDKGHPSKREPVIMEPPPASTDSSGQTPDFVAPAASTLVLELNTADSLDLQQLAGIGPAFSRRIVKYRQLLGGYARVDQLLEVYGMDSARYLLIAGHLTVDTTKVQRMDLRTATLKELMRHPYIEFYVAKLLVSCREPSDTTRSYSELEEISGIPPALLNRIRPYLSFQ